nr:RsmD family RNA methyltransferase [Nakamurella aerolata]
MRHRPRPGWDAGAVTRIVSGRWKGRTLATPSGSVTRPSSEKMRAALGNALTAATDLDGLTVLDLYAGSGALGLELLSRGAGRLTCVEVDRKALESLRRNVSDLRAGAEVVVVPGKVETVLGQLPAAAFDIVVADPPYALTNDDLRRVLALLVPTLRPGADVVVERAARAGAPPWPPELEPGRGKTYGDTALWYAVLASAPPTDPSAAPPRPRTDPPPPRQHGSAS